MDDLKRAAYQAVVTAHQPIDGLLSSIQKKARDEQSPVFDDAGIESVDEFLLVQSPTLLELAEDCSTGVWDTAPIYEIAAGLKIEVAVRMARFLYETTPARVAERRAEAERESANEETTNPAETTNPFDHEQLDEAVARLAWIMCQGLDFGGVAVREFRRLMRMSQSLPNYLAKRLARYLVPS